MNVMVSRLFDQQSADNNNKENIKAPHFWSMVFSSQRASDVQNVSWRPDAMPKVFSGSFTPSGHQQLKWASKSELKLSARPKGTM